MSELRALKLNLNPKKSQRKKRLFPLLLLVILISFLGFLAYAITRPEVSPVIFQTVLGQEKDKLKTDDSGRVNILLLGIGGGNHDGANLTDTIMVASYNPDKKEVSLISLPRDIWSDKYKAKINAIYEIGLAQDNGLGLTEEEIGHILGLQIPYAVRVDFSGFERAVDLVGGLDINVAHTFDDYFYPVEGKEDDMCGYKFTSQNISDDQAQTLGVTPGQLQVLLDPSGNIATSAASPSAQLNLGDDQGFDYFKCRYEHLSFKQGLTHMNGATALKFVRSRHGTNGEGSDFSRSKRQQLVVQAFKDKVLSLNILTDVSKLVSLTQTFQSSIDTNIAQSDYLAFAKIAQDIQQTQSYSIDTSGYPPLLVVPTSGDYGGAWVLSPTDKDYNQIHKFVSSALSGQLISSASAKVVP